MHRLALLLLAAVLAAPAARAAGAASKGRVLVVASSTSTLALKGGKSVPTGYFLNELAIPAERLVAAGYEVVLATPSGEKPVMDARSNDPSKFGNDAAAQRRALEFVQTYPGVTRPRSLKAVVAEGLDRYAGVFVPGGHAPINDLMQDPELGRVLRHFHQRSQPTALLCHGPVAMLAALPQAPAYRQALLAGDAAGARAAAAGWPYAGYRMTIYSNDEELVAQEKFLHGELPFFVADALRGAGGQVENGPRFQPFVVRDRELITGQNPASDAALADALLRALDEGHRS